MGVGVKMLICPEGDDKKKDHMVIRIKMVYFLGA